MTYPVSNVDVSSDTFRTWVDTTNEMASLFRTDVVTANATSTGAVSTGNAFVNGIFSSQTLVAVGGLRGGSVAANGNLTITSNAAFSTNTALLFTGNTTLQTASISVVANTTNSRFTFAAFDTSNTTVQNGGYLFMGVANTSNTYALMSLNNQRMTYKSGNVAHAGNFGIYDVTGTRVGP